MANINKIGDMIEQDNKWIKFESGDKKVLKFYQEEEPKRIEGDYQGTPTIRYEFKVLDLSTNTDKLWAVGKKVASQLRDYSAEEKLRAAQQFNFFGESTNVAPAVRARV